MFSKMTELGYMLTFVNFALSIAQEYGTMMQPDSKEQSQCPAYVVDS